MEGFSFPEPFKKCFNTKILCKDCKCDLCLSESIHWKDIDINNPSQNNIITNKISSNKSNVNNLKNVILMYLTNYSYRNLWSPFLKIKNKYMNFDIDTLFCSDYITDNKESNFNFLRNLHLKILETNEKSDISCINGNTIKRMKFYLNEIKEDFILFNLDDMFCVNKIDECKLKQIIDIMNDFPDIALIKLSLASYPFYQGKTIKINDSYFVEANKLKDKYLMNLQPFIIRTKIFIELMDYIETIPKTHNISQMSYIEVFGTTFLETSNYRILRSETDIFPIITSMGMVSGSKLIPRYIEWSEYENIEIKNNDLSLLANDEKKYMKDHPTLK